jgi:DNA-binding IclR family transcriptional regulator
MTTIPSPARRRPGSRNTRSTGVGVLDRAIAILDAVQHGASTHAAVVKATGMSRTTAHRLLRSLEEHGLLAQGGGRGYRLGPYLLQLAASSLHEMPLVALAHPALERLAANTGESSQLWVASIDGRVCVDTVQSQSELRAIVDLGTELPMTAGSAGKVFMAFAATDEARRHMIRNAAAFTPKTPVGEDLERDLFHIRRRGWAYSSGEREPGVGSVSAPIFGIYGVLVGVVSVSGPATRLNKIGARRYAPAVMEAAREIQRALGVTA